MQSKQQLPELGHIEALRKVDVAEPIDRAPYLKQGNHLIVGQRKQRGTTDSLVLLGKCIESTRLGNKYDANVWLDVRTPHVVYIVGKRGSGKSYDLGILAEGLLLGKDSRVATKDAPITSIIFDTQDQFWSLSSPPNSNIGEDQQQLLDIGKWGLKPEAVPNVQLLTPRGAGAAVPLAVEFSIDPADLDIDDWCSLIKEERYTSIGHTLSLVLEKTARTGYTTTSSSGGGGRRVPPKPRFEMQDLLNCLREDQDLNSGTQVQTRNAVLWRLSGLSNSALFASGGTNIRSLLVPGRLSILLIRRLDNATKAIVVSVLAKKIFTLMGEYHTHLKLRKRLGVAETSAYYGLPQGAWVFIDEAHLVCPADNPTSAKDTLIEYVKRGRDAGLSLVLATQQPSAIDSKVLSQVDLVLAHRLVMEGDIAAALARMPASLPASASIGGQTVSSASALVRMLDTREAWIADAETSRAFLVAMRPRITSHGGDEPMLI